VQNRRRETLPQHRLLRPPAGIPRYYQVHTGIRDYEIPDSRARVVPFVEFAKELAV